MTESKTHEESEIVQLDRRLRRARAGVTVVGAALLAAFATVATSSPSVPDFLVAKTFRLVDDAGSLRGILETDADGRVVLSVISKDGKPASRLVLDQREPRLAVYDATGSKVGVVDVAAGAAQPEPNASSPEAAGTGAAEREAAEPAPIDKKGVVRWGSAEEDDEDAFDWAD
jgi:hypothetical protein